MNDSIKAAPPPMEHLAAQHQRFLRFLSARIADPATAEDILQAAYVKAMSHADALREQDSIVAWFYRILRNSLIDHYRRDAARSNTLNMLAPELPVSYETELRDQVCECVGDLVQGLKPEYRHVIEQVDLAEEPVAAFAGTAGITVNNATVRLHRARRALAGQLAKTCGVCAEHKCVDCTCRRH